jgi:hypothetical protein
VIGRTRGDPLSTREAVAEETPAACATSASVGGDNTVSVPGTLPS